jgi:translation initiation factor 2B subunit (eIF-2B alpha/beta/delta family)
MSPLSAAWREIKEETTLTPRSLALMRQGKSYSLSDSSVGREWTIYPFAFRLKTAEEGGMGESAIQIDWEHVGWAWYDPLEVEDSEKFGGVPKLAESLRRVWFEKDLGERAGKCLTNGLAKLQNDHQSGARQLAGVALQILHDVIAEMESHNPSQEWWYKVRFAAWHIWKNGRESMGAAIMNVLLSALKGIEDTLKEQQADPDCSYSPKWRDAVLRNLERRLALRGGNSAKPVSEAFAKYLESNFSSKLASMQPLSILTLSESSTILHGIRHLVLESGFALDLRILESRPLYEGVSMAGSFVSEILSATEHLKHLPHGSSDGQPLPRVKITIYSDASAALASQGVDAVVIGADRISSSGAVSNKTGSLPAVLSAKHVTAVSSAIAARVIILGESEKVAPPEKLEEHVVENNDPLQLGRSWEAEYNSEPVRSVAKTLGFGGGNPRAIGFDGIELEVRNVFFEWVDQRLIDAYITEFGQWTSDDIAKHSEQLGAEEKRLFEDL